MGEYAFLKIMILIEMSILSYGVDYYSSKYGADRHCIFFFILIVSGICYWLGTHHGG
jgi:hypothetical protein